MGKKRELSIRTQWIGVFILASIFALSGAAMSYFFHIQYIFKNAHVLEKWEEAPCKIKTLTVIKKSVRSHRRRGLKSGGVRRRKSGSSTDHFVIHAVYEYNYQGKQYTSAVFDLQDFSSPFGKSMKEKRVAEILKLDQPTCFVNPENPEEAILEAKVSLDSWTPTVAGMILILVSILTILKIRSMFAKQKIK